jgi:hypothetical protein
MPTHTRRREAVHHQVSLFQKLAEVLLERVPTRAGQRNYIADGDASVAICRSSTPRRF